ncbi:MULTISPECIES: hypothetical protein [unclassified Synechococcus]|nr:MULTISPECIES: hypothetical protein [unclassified Synechococcus]
MATITAVLALAHKLAELPLKNQIAVGANLGLLVVLVLLFRGMG